MELFLLLAIALSIVSFISIALNKPITSSASSPGDTAPREVLASEMPRNAPHPGGWMLQVGERYSEELTEKNLTVKNALATQASASEEALALPQTESIR